MKIYIFRLIALLVAATSANASGSFYGNHVASTWYLNGTTLHYTTEVYAGTNYLYGSMDPTGRDNSSWFMVADNMAGQILEGGFEDIYSEGYYAPGLELQVHQGVIDVAGRDLDSLDVLTGASFMIGPRALDCDTTTVSLGDAEELPY